MRWGGGIHSNGYLLWNLLMEGFGGRGNRHFKAMGSVSSGTCCQGSGVRAVWSRGGGGEGEFRAMFFYA